MPGDVPDAQIGSDADDHVDPRTLGFQDVRLNGWFNEASGELAPGFKIEAEDVVIDVGCGDGGALHFCATRGCYVILADIDAARVAAARSRIEVSPARGFEEHVTDAAPLPVADGTATRVICMEVMEHVDDPAAFMGELVRVGAPGALYLLTVPDSRMEQLQKTLAPAVYFEKPNHVRVFEREGFAKLVEGAGLMIEQRGTYGFFWAMWWLLFGIAGVPFEGDLRHPALDHWARTWAAVLAAKDGMRLKGVLDDAMGKSQMIIARKPG